MVLFLLIVCSVPALGLLWLAWADWRLRRVRAPGWQRIVLAAMVAANVLGFGMLIASRVLEWGFEVPLALLASTFIWHIVVLPSVLLLSVGMLTGDGALWAFRRVRAKREGAQASVVAERAPPAQARGLSRRQVLGAGLFGAPVAMQATALTAGLSQLDAFRTREIVVSLPQLPIDFEGFTIAHITDTHVGRFTYGQTLDAIVERVNALQADCIVHTGDLINDSLEDMIPAGAMLARLRSRHGTFIVEGNHDLFESRTRFASLLRTPELKAANLRLLLDEAATIERGSGRLQLLGMQWGNTMTEDVRTDRGRGPMLAEHAQILDGKRDPRAFAVLLAHHPDAFDQALRRDIPLTLAGHTHGGQLNIAEGLGPASATYRYISGLYTKQSDGGLPAACVVGNGTGNWFPLRINAPAEIIKITLRRA
jgi:hypothetical protein